MLSSLVLCSVTDVDRVLAGITRVLKPGGQYRFVEHVASRHPWACVVPHAVEPVRRHLTRGCRLPRDGEGRIRRSPLLALTRCEPVRAEGIMPFLRGRAVELEREDQRRNGLQRDPDNGPSPVKGR